jgi:hypothetical protein
VSIVVNQQLVSKRFRADDEPGWPVRTEPDNSSDHSLRRYVYWSEMADVAPNSDGRVDDVGPDSTGASRVERKSSGDRRESSQRLTPA